MAYATQTDVLRVLGGTEKLLKERFGLTLWAGAVTSVTVDEETFNVPDILLARVNDQLVKAESRVDGYVLKQYKRRPTVIPANLTDCVAKIAAYNSTTTDGTRTQYLRDNNDDAMAFLKDMAMGRVDLGLNDDPRPAHKMPAPYFSPGRSGSCC